jgi:hypothetical protein
VQLPARHSASELRLWYAALLWHLYVHMMFDVSVDLHVPANVKLFARHGVMLLQRTPGVILRNKASSCRSSMG